MKLAGYYRLVDYHGFMFVLLKLHECKVCPARFIGVHTIRMGKGNREIHSPVGGYDEAYPPKKQDWLDAIDSGEAKLIDTPEPDGKPTRGTPVAVGEWTLQAKSIEYVLMVAEKMRMFGP